MYLLFWTAQKFDKISIWKRPIDFNLYFKGLFGQEWVYTTWYTIEQRDFKYAYRPQFC